MNRIVVVRAGALGDVVLTFPALTLLRDRYPDARITAVGHPELWEAAGDLVDRAESIDDPRFAGLFSGEPGQELRDWLEGVDLVVAWTAHDPSAALERTGVPRVVHASPYPPPRVHAAKWLVAGLSSGLSAGGGSLAVYGVNARMGSGSASAQRPAGPRCAGGGTVVVGGRAKALDYAATAMRLGGEETPVFIHPGAGAGWKRWPTERFAAVGERLREEGLSVMLVEGPADEEVVAAVQGDVSVPFSVLRDMSSAALAEELKRGRLFIGNDSGVTHLAAWNGVPSIALFGPTDPTSWAPIGDVQVLRGCDRRATRQGEIRVCDEPDCMERMPLERVLAAAMAAVRNDGGGEPCR